MSLPICHHCEEPIEQSHLLRVGPYKFHPDHFVCKTCGTELRNSKFLFKENAFYCEEHFHGQFAKKCARCNGHILPGHVIQAFGKLFHPEHFSCEVCDERFEEGKYFELEGAAYCSAHYLAMVNSSKCHKCQKLVAQTDAVLVQNNTYHSSCVFCHACGAQLLTDGNQSVFQHEGDIFCRADYLARFAPRCTKCGDFIEDNCISANEESYHRDCFRCSVCAALLDNYVRVGGHLRCDDHVQDPAPRIDCGRCGLQVRKDLVLSGGLQRHFDCFRCADCDRPLAKPEARAPPDRPKDLLCHGCFDQALGPLPPCARERDEKERAEALEREREARAQGREPEKPMSPHKTLSEALRKQQRELRERQAAELRELQLRQERELEAQKQRDILNIINLGAPEGEELKQPPLPPRVEEEFSPIRARMKQIHQEQQAVRERQRRELMEQEEYRKVLRERQRKKQLAEEQRLLQLQQQLQQGSAVSGPEDEIQTGAPAYSSGPASSFASAAGALSEQYGRSPLAWKRGDEIGRGAFGRVYMALLEDTGELIAVKQVKLSKHDDNLQMVTSMESEISLMETLRHPNIVSLLGTQRKGSKFNILMEYVPGNSLDKILSKFGAFSEKVIRNYTKQLLSALAYCHANNVVHRDIKAKNILVDTKGSLKLADFGSAKRFEDAMGQAAPSLSYNYTPLWTAPEVLTGNYDSKVDIWSLGCVLVEMGSGNPPWSECRFENPFRALYHIGNSDRIPELPARLSPEALDFMRWCLTRNPERRPSAKQLLRHPWILGQSLPPGYSPFDPVDEDEEVEGAAASPLASPSSAASPVASPVAADENKAADENNASSAAGENSASAAENNAVAGDDSAADAAAVPAEAEASAEQ